MNTDESEQTRLLREILKWIKFAGAKEVKTILLSALNTEQKRLVYHLSDGTRGTVEVAKIAKVGSTGTIFDMWQTWIKQGLGESIPVKGGSRFKRSFDLDEFGIPTPEYAPKQEAEASVKITSAKES
ncbi:MAG: hypothetical protein NWE95_01710 [Candidatus Bathyarchaeota archaeon]|nr:hypothetical protein [Candidatus Bathyarchaeota archaeon]